MNIMASGIDYKTSTVDMREKLSFDKEKTKLICRRILNEDGINGCVIISTCNRTEIFISHNDFFNGKPSDILLKASGRKDFKGHFHQYSGKAAVRYIIEVACGLHSQILGESQIIGQINSAVSDESGMPDSVLNKLFQTAVTAGKCMQTNAKITAVPVSSAYGAVELIKRKYGNICGKKALVIGNGKMGRLAQRLLIDSGCEVWVTLREYKGGGNDVLKGCRSVLYSRRYEKIKECDFVISATKSPHYTVAAAELERLERLPEVMIDLAVPRDIEGECKRLAECFNVDDLNIETGIDENQLENVMRIAERYEERFEKWYNYKMSLDIIGKIKETVCKRVCGKETAEKTIDIIFGSMNDDITPEKLYGYYQKIKKRTRV